MTDGFTPSPVGWWERWMRPGVVAQRVGPSGFLHNVLETMTARIFVLVLGMLTTVLVARALGPSGRGYYAVAATTMAIGIQLGNFGLHASNTYHVARDPGSLGALLGNSLLVGLGLGGLGAAAAWVVFTVWPALAPAGGNLLLLALAGIPLGITLLLVQNLLLGVHEVRLYNASEVLGRLAVVALILLLLAIGHARVTEVFVAGLAAPVLGLCWGIWHLARRPAGKVRGSADVLRQNLRYGIKAYLAALFAFLVLRADLLIVQYRLGPEQAGYYSIAVALSDLINMLPVVVGSLLFPRLVAASTMDQKFRLMVRATTGVAAVLGVLGLGALILARPLTTLLFGRAYADAVPAFVLLIPGIVFLGVQSVAVQFLNSLGFPRAMVAVWGVVCLANLPLAYWAVGRSGIVGAALVSSASYLLVFIASTVLIRRYTTHG